MAITNKDTFTRIKESTGFRLDMLRGNKSHDAFVAEMLLYFGTAGAAPQSNVIPSNIATREQASRVIGAVRGIEESIDIKLKNIKQLLLSLVGEVKTPGDNPDEYAYISRVQGLLEHPKQLEREARESREKAGELQTDLEIARQEKGAPAVRCDTHKILEIVERIDEMKKMPTFDDTVYEIDRSTLDMWVKRLKDKLKR